MAETKVWICPGSKSKAHESTVARKDWKSLKPSASDYDHGFQQQGLAPSWAMSTGFEKCSINKWCAFPWTKHYQTKSDKLNIIPNHQTRNIPNPKPIWHRPSSDHPKSSEHLIKTIPRTHSKHIENHETERLKTHWKKHQTDKTSKRDWKPLHKTKNNTSNIIENHLYPFAYNKT